MIMGGLLMLNDTITVIRQEKGIVKKEGMGIWSRAAMWDKAGSAYRG
jgi:hypothetical protein